MPDAAEFEPTVESLAIEPELDVELLASVLLELGGEAVDEVVDDVVDEVDVDESIVEPLGAACGDGALSVPLCEPVVGETPVPDGAVPDGGLVVC